MAEDETQFGRFAVDIQNFQQTLYTLVISSFLFSAISAIAQGSHIAEDPALAAATTLFGTVAGSAAVLMTYMAWSPHPSRIFATTLRFIPDGYRWEVLIEFGVSLVAMYFYYTAARERSDLSLLAVSVGSFFFFRALVTSALVAKRIEEQARTWQAMTVEQRVEWLQSEQRLKMEELESERELREVSESADESVQTMQRAVKHARDTLRESEKRRRLRKIKSYLEKGHGHTIRMRKAIAGERLLTGREKLREWERQQRTRRAVEKLNAEWAREFHEEIVQEKSRPLTLEGTDFHFFRKGAWVAAIFPGSLTQESAGTLIGNLQRASAEIQTDRSGLLVFIDETSSVSAEARRALMQADVRVYRIGSWSTL